MKKRVASLLGVLVASALLLAQPTQAVARESHRPTTTIRVTPGGLVVMPKTLTPGLAHLHVTGNSPGGVLLVRKKKRGLKTFLHMVNSLSHAVRLRRQQVFDYLIYSQPDAQNWVRLHRGTYFAFDANLVKINRADILKIHVRGSVRNATPPAATTIIQTAATRSIPASITTRRRDLRLVDRSDVNFLSLILAPLTPGAHRAAITNLIARPTFRELRQLSLSDEAATVPAEVGPGHTAITRDGYPKGRYLMYTTYGTQRKQLRHGDVGLLVIR